ncbi:MAG: phosphatidylserine decarboxylase family protein [Desulfovibrionales bacterium]
MRKPSFEVSPEGVHIILAGGFVTLIAALLGWTLVAVAGLIVTLLSLNFFLDPQRVVPHAADLAVAPADGKIVRVGPSKDPFTGEEREVVSIFMNVFNVHVNRVPVDGKLSNLRYTPGKFFNATLDKASEDNERNALQLTDEEGRTWTVVQIAGLIARRIVCRAEVGDSLARGERFGLIKFGSRVDVYLPHDYTSTVQPGKKVLAGQSVIAQKKS